MTAETTIGDATLTASGIARLAGVGRAAVSNWRRRYADFPAPVGGTLTSPYFSARDVDAWLRRQGKIGQTRTEEWTWRLLETYQPAARFGHVLAIAGAYLLTQAHRPTKAAGTPDPHRLDSLLRAIDPSLAELIGPTLPEQWDPQLLVILQSVDSLAQEQDPETAFEYLHRQYVSAAQSPSGLANTPEVVAELMLILSGTGATTFDFTCGTGSILRCAADRALADGRHTHCYAQEVRPDYAAIALIRLWFVHLRAPKDAPAPTVQIGDSLFADGFPDLRADVVLANFPFGIHDWGHDQLVYDPRWAYGLPPRTESELAWVQHALAHLAPGGTAVVLMPPAAAARPAGRRIRAELIRRGTLRAVVALPPGLMSPSGIGLHLWVLATTESQQAQSTSVLFVDAAHTDDLAGLVGTAWQRFGNSHNPHSPGQYHCVPAIELLDEHVDVTPQRHVPREEPTVEPAETIRRIADFTRLATALVHGLPDLRPAHVDTLGTASRVSLADLIRAGSMSIDRITTPVRVADRPGRRYGPADLNSARPRAVVGDIALVTSGRALTTWVITAEHHGTEIKAGTYLLRVEPERFDPWFVAAMILHGSARRPSGRTSGTESGTGRLDPRRLTIPVVPPAEQQQYGTAFRQLADFQARLGEASELGTTLARELHDGLTSGAVAPSDEQPPA